MLGAKQLIKHIFVLKILYLAPIAQNITLANFVNPVSLVHLEAASNCLERSLEIECLQVLKV